VKEDPNLVALEGSIDWWAMEGKKTTFFLPLLIFPPTNFT
jgi:hypothetical protein